MNIKIENVEYELDIERAKLNGSLKRAAIKARDIRAGDVYNHPNVNSFLVIQATFSGDNCYQILGLGASPNSNIFFHELHTKEQIADYLNSKEMVFSKNINKDICALVGF